MIRGAQAAEGGLQGAGACSGPRGSPGQHARLWVSRCRLLKRRSSIVGGRSIFSNFQHPPDNSMIRGAQAAEGGLQGAGACSGPRGSPGQHARLWVSRCRLLKRRSSIVGGRSIFSNFQHPPENSYDPRCAGSGGRTPGCRRLLGASGQPGAACAPLGKQMPALEAPVQHRRGEVDFLEFPTPPGELDDPRCAGSGGRTPGCRRLLGASGQPGAACAPLGKQMPALEAPVQHRRGEVHFLEFPTPPGELDDPRCAGSGGRTPGCRRLLGASGQPGAACAPLGKQMPALEAPVQHRRGEVDFLEFPTPPGELDDPRCAGSGGRTPGCRRVLGASGQPGAACAPLGKQMPALEAPVQHRRGEVDFLEFPTPPGELDDPRCAGSGGRTPGCRRLLGASGQPGAACAPLGKQMPALEAPVQHRRGEVDFLEFPTPPGELDDPRCAGSGGRTPGCRRLLGASGQPGAACAPLGKQMPALEAPVQHRRGEVDFLEFPTPPGELDDRRCAGSGGRTPGCRRLLGASGQPGAACAPLGKQMPALEAPVQHRRGEVDFLEFPTPPGELDDPRCAGSGGRTPGCRRLLGASGQPRAACASLGKQMPALEAPVQHRRGEVDFLEFQTPPGELDDPRCAGSGGRTPGCRRLLGASGQPGAACAPLGKQMPALEAPVQHRRGEVDFLEFPTPPGHPYDRRCAGSGGRTPGCRRLLGASGQPGAACAPLGKQMPALEAPVQHRRGEVDFLEFPTPPGELDDPRCAGSGGRTPGCRRLLGASGQPGAACAPLGKQMPALEAPVQHRRGEVDFLEFPTPPGELDDPRCAGSGGRTPGCRRLLGASGQPRAACASLGKQMPALEAPVQHRRGEVDFLEFPKLPGELDDPRCAGSGGRTPGGRRLLGASGQPGAACAPLGKQMPALEALVKHRRGEVDFLEFPTPPGHPYDRRCAGSGGRTPGCRRLLGASGQPGAACAPLGKQMPALEAPVQHRREQVDFLEFPTPPGELDDPRCAGSGGRTPGCRRLLGASGQPGAACAPLGKQMPALEAPVQHRRGEVDFLEFPTPPGELDDPRCAGSGGRTPGCRRLLGASGQPGAACAPLGKQMPALEAPVQHRRGEVDFLEFPTPPGELDDPRCAGSGGRTPGCRRLLGASGQPRAACASLGKQMPALEAPVQHRRGEVDFLEFPKLPGELDDPRCAGSGGRTPGGRRLLGASGQPGAACAPLGKQMPALEALVKHRRGEVDFLEFPTPPGHPYDRRCAGSGGRTPGCRRLLGASGQPGAACAPLGKQMPALEAPVQHRREQVDFLEFPTPPGELDDPRCAGSGGRTPGCRRLLGASGQPGAACAPLGKQMPALEAPVQHRRGEVDFLEFPTPPGELDDPRCAGSGGRTPGCRRLLGASGQPRAACASLGKQMPALEAPVQHRRGEVDFLEFPKLPGELDDPRCAGSGGRTPGGRRLLGASGQPGAACAPLGKQMPALEALVKHRRGEVDFLEFPTPPGHPYDRRCAGSGGRTPGCRRLLGASGQPGAACAPLGKQMPALEAPVQHRREQVDFLEFPTPPGELDDPRCAGSGGRTPGCRRLLGASGQPGAACAPLGKQMPALEAPVQHRRGEVDFLEFPTPPGELDDPRCAGSGGRTPGCRRLLGASGQPGAACAPLGKQMPALEAPVQHRRGEVDFLEFPTPPGELDDPRCAGSGGRTPGCRRLLGASGQPRAACASLGKQMPALEAPVQHRRGEVDFLEFPKLPGELDDPRCAGSGGRTPGGRRLLGASGQPGAACAPLGKQMPALEALVKHRRGEVDFLEFPTPPGHPYDRRCAGSGGRTPGCRRLLGASGQPGAACAPLGKQMPALEAPVQHRREQVDFLEFPTPPGELDDPRCAGSGGRTPGCRRLLGASGQPGAACAPLGKQMPALEAPVQHRRGEVDFLEFPTPPGELDDPRCAGSGGRTPGCRRLLGASGQPGAACAPLGKQMPALEAPVQHRRGEVDFLEFPTPPGELDDPRCAGSGGRTPGCRRLLGASGQPGAACAPLGKQMPALEAPVQHRRGEVDFLEFPTPHGRGR
jgi:hypothetical protein